MNAVEDARLRNTPTRRVFIRRALSLTCLGALSGLENACTSRRPASVRRPPLLPPVDGEWLSDEATRAAVATDWGNQVHRSPRAVLRPASAADVIRAVRYARQTGLKIAMRGGGHCVSGQAQVEDGIVIDSSPLNAVRWSGGTDIDAEPGALFGDVARFALTRRLTPPVMPDALMLTVGGLVSVGGTGEMSHRAGAIVDHVDELDVVTGTGDLVTCSPHANEELFGMVLAGLGQCGIIVRTRLQLQRAPLQVEVRRFVYDTPEPALEDLTELTSSESPATLVVEITPTPERRWRIALLAGSYDQRRDDGDTPVWAAGLRFTSQEPRVTRAYFDHLDRRTASVSAAQRRASPNPALAVVLPASSTLPFLKGVLSRGDASVGIWRIEVLPLRPARLGQPLHVVPAGDLAFTVRLQRRASAPGAADHEAMLSANRMLLREASAASGKVYPPFAPILSPHEWRTHYGPATWRRFLAAKQQFDPANILTPGPNIFS